MEFWVLVLSAVLNLLLALAILSQALRVSSVAYFGAALLFIALWSGGALLMAHAPSYELTQLGILVFVAAPAIALVCMILFFRNFRRQYTKHRNLRLLFLSVVAMSLLTLSTNVILPALGYTELVWLGPVWTVLFIVIAAQSLAEYGLIDLRRIYISALTHGVSLAVVALLYYGALYVLLAWPDQAVLLPGNLVLVLALAVIYQYIHRTITYFTETLVHRGGYSVDTFFAELGRTLSDATSLSELLHQAAYGIVQTMRAADVSFVVYTGDERSTQVGEGRYSKVSYKDARWLDDYLGGEATIKVVSRLTDEEGDLRRLMVSHRVAAILPLATGEGLVGYLLLGHHKRSGYSPHDMRLMGALADELAIAIQNALSVQKVRELNSHLEQRVDAATKELRRSNAQLQRLDEAKDEFISMASHQLRTPLTSIKGYISMLMEGDVGPISPQQKHLLNEAFVSSERMVRLIGDFLNVSRLQTGKFVIEKRPVDLATLVERELDGLEPNAQARGMRFSYRKPKTIPVLNLDENKIQQVVMNFADNALYYSKEKATISVRLRKVGKLVEFTVTDTGIGVPKSEQAHLFSKFFRATNARKVRPDGTGVGLFLAKRVIDDHGGSIIFSSKEGKGSTFGFRLPISK